MPLSNESSIRTARYSLPPCLQSATWVCSLFRRSWTLSFVTSGGLVSFLPTAVTVRVTVPGSAATAFAANNPNAKATVPVISAIRLGFALFIILITPFTYLHVIRCIIARNAYMKGLFRSRGGGAGRSPSTEGGGLLHE